MIYIIVKHYKDYGHQGNRNGDYTHISECDFTTLGRNIDISLDKAKGHKLSKVLVITTEGDRVLEWVNPDESGLIS